MVNTNMFQNSDKNCSDDHTKQKRRPSREGSRSFTAGVFVESKQKIMGVKDEYVSENEKARILRQIVQEDSDEDDCKSEDYSDLQ